MPSTKNEFVKTLSKFPLKTILFITFLITFTITARRFAMSASNIVSIEFEVFGVVQGVFFRKYTKETSTRMGLRGWCMNTEKGTVRGVLEGRPEKIKEMKHWLQHTGSPSSRIDRAEFSNERTIKDYSFADFSIRH